MNLYMRIGILFALAFIATGCVSMQPLSNYARTGDTVAISLGGTDTNALVPVLKKERVTVTITDANGATYPVKLRNLVRLYSDPTSSFNGRAGDGSTQNWEGFVDRDQGLWFAVIDLVDPGSGQTPPLATGQAKLSVSSPDLQAWVDYPGFGWAWTNGNLSEIPIQILAGTGAANPLNYMQPLTYYPMDSLEADPQVEVTLSGTPASAIGGGFFTFRYTTQSLKRLRVTSTSLDPNIQLASRKEDQGDGTTLLKVMIMNPHGFRTVNEVNTSNPSQSLLRSFRFSIAWDNTVTTVTDGNWQTYLQLVSANFVNTNGNAMSGLNAALAKTK